MTVDNRPRVYLAGPEVFLPDAIAVGAEKCRLCAEYGFEGLFPLDASLELSGLSKARSGTPHRARQRGVDALGRCHHRQPDAIPRVLDGRRHGL